MESKSESAKTQVLDHGYVELIESWGSDASIVSAARMSTGKGFLGWGKNECKFCGLSKQEFDCGYVNVQKCADDGHEFVNTPGDEKLLRYMYENKHDSPFEFAGMVIEVQAPIFVFREWMRHRTQSFSEASARYAPLPDFNYVPSVERLLVNSKTNKQAGTIKGSAELTGEQAQLFRTKLNLMYKEQESLYQTALASGVPKELARVHLPVARYSRMRAQANLRNWLAFLTLRMAPNAQQEIREYANAVGTLIQDRFPRTWDLFVEGKR